MSTPYIYFLGLGSNIEPALNISRTINRLQQQFDHLLLWPVVETAPVGLNSQHPFYNTLVVIKSDWSPLTLKAWCNHLETEAGRDRQDPLCSQKDRPLDIDILAQQSQLSLSIVEQFTEPYVREVVLAEHRDLHKNKTLQVANYRLGKRPATVYTDYTSGHVVVIEDSIDSLFQRFEAPFNRQQSIS